MKRWVWASVAVVLLLAVSVGGILHARYLRDVRPPEIADELEHFKYGSIGAEVNGLPYAVWRALPRIVPDKVPGGWQAFGFLYEPGRSHPIGLPVRRWSVDRVGFNCATCHTSRIEGRSELLLGAPAETLDLERYLHLLMSLPDDPRFNADAIVAAIKADDPDFDFLDEAVYRLYIVPQLRTQLRSLHESNAWMATRAPHGPGRTDAGNPWRQKFGLNPREDLLNGVTDFPHIWAQDNRKGTWAHWDGNNASLHERNLSAALAGGATPESLDHRAIERVAAWSLVAPAPPFPGPVDASAAARGQAVFTREQCGTCHDPGGPRFGQTTAVHDIGTDRDRYDVFSQALLDEFATVGEGYPWRFRNYRKSDGYANLPLDGLWARAPYLHNGSVPTLDALLRPPGQRPAKFLRGCTRLDVERVGFTCAQGSDYDTSRRGNGNSGHLYGTALPEAERRDLLEYLKTR